MNSSSSQPSTDTPQPTAPKAPYNRNIWSPLDRGIQHSTQDNVGRWCRLRVYRNHCELTRFDPLHREAPTTTATFTSPEAARLDAERWLNFEGCMHDL